MARTVQYARTETKSAFMSGDFAVSYATRLFGAETVANLPRISRGKRKGLVKGMLSWTKCIVGGWQRSGAFGGGVVYPGFVSAEIEVDGKVVMTTSYPTYEKKMAREAEEKALMRASNIAWQNEQIEIYSKKAVNYETLIAMCDADDNAAGIPAETRQILADDMAKNAIRLQTARDNLAIFLEPEKMAEAA